MDGDSDVDVAIGRLGQNGLLLNDGDGNFIDGTPQLPAREDPTGPLLLEDFDGDGDLDLFVGNFAAPNRLLLNDGTGTFVDAPLLQIPFDVSGTTDLAAGDLDADGDVDIFLANSNAQLGQVNHIYLNDGSGGFFLGLGSLPFDRDSSNDVELVDIDGDGDLDALVANFGQANRLYRNDGSGVFSDASALIGVNLDDTHFFEAGDVDGDGDFDVFAAASSTCSLAGRHVLLLNDGTGFLSESPASFTPLTPCAGAVPALADVDQDGDVDITFVETMSFASDRTRVFQNDGAGNFAEQIGSFADESNLAQRLALVDLDGDGDPDAFFANRQQDNLYLNDASGFFTRISSRSPSPLLLAETEFADLDGDGDVDALALMIEAPQQPSVLDNDGSGNFIQRVGAVPAIAKALTVELGDVDGDGDADAMIGTKSIPGGSDQLLLNDGTGGFTDASGQMPVGDGETVGLDVGDVDGDGDLDALAGQYSDFTVAGGSPNRLYVNDGAGNFSDGSAGLPGTIARTLDVALGDLDGDGDLDAVAANEGQQNRLLRNLGGGVFQDVTAALPALTDETAAVALGDMDGDGLLDVFFGNFGQQDRLYRNTGMGSFVDVTNVALPIDTEATTSVALGDLDGDGDLDAYTAGADRLQPISAADTPRLLQNDGSGLLTDVSSSLPVLLTVGPVTIADIDADDDLDVWISGEPMRILTNVQRQLAWRYVPRIGRDLTMEIFGPGAAGWILARSSGPASIPFPPFGTLRIDPSTLQIVATGVLDADGEGEQDFAVPNDPALVGVSFFWQALVGLPFRLTNLEITGLTGL